MTDIIGYPDYTINDKGEIYSKKRKIVMKQWLDKDGYFQIRLTNNKIKTTLLVHRLVYQTFKLKIGEEMPAEVDHKNRIKIDNSLDNLRGATRQENSRNMGKHKDNTSGHKNIRITPDGTFRIQIRIGKGKDYSKCFKTLEEAIIDRDIKTIELHGEFANNGNQITDEIMAGSTEDLNLV